MTKHKSLQPASWHLTPLCAPPFLVTSHFGDSHLFLVRPISGMLVPGALVPGGGDRRDSWCRFLRQVKQSRHEGGGVHSTQHTVHSSQGMKAEEGRNAFDGDNCPSPALDNTSPALDNTRHLSDNCPFSQYWYTPNTGTCATCRRNIILTQYNVYQYYTTNIPAQQYSGRCKTLEVHLVD